MAKKDNLDLLALEAAQQHMGKVAWPTVVLGVVVAAAYVVAAMTRSPLHAIRAALQMYIGQYRYYVKNRWSKGPRSQNLYLCLEVFAALAPRLAFLGAGFWVEGLAMFAIGWLLGISLLLFLFAYIVHTPHESVGRYVDTSTIVVSGMGGKLVTLLWGFQNYHSIHHLFPRVPFYTYRALFEEIEPIMAAKGAPIYHLGTGGLQASENVAA